MDLERMGKVLEDDLVFRVVRTFVFLESKRGGECCTVGNTGELTVRLCQETGEKSTNTPNHYPQKAHPINIQTQIQAISSPSALTIRPHHPQ